MSKQLKTLDVTEITVPDAGTVATRALTANSLREHLMVKYEGSNFYVGYGDEPTGTAAAIKAAMTLIDADYSGDFWDFAGMPRAEVWFYQDNGGGNLTVKVREGSA